MDASLARRIEAKVDRVASALFGAAAAYAAALALKPHLGPLQLAPIALAGGIAASALAFRILCAIEGGEARFILPDLEHQGFEPDEELLLTDVFFADAIDDQALVLDDILAKLGSEARVVRLFDAAAMPTPGELKASVDGHLDADRRLPELPDASQALHEALAELRRSLS